jgi:hypothetical protein
VSAEIMPKLWPLVLRRLGMNKLPALQKCKAA